MCSALVAGCSAPVVGIVLTSVCTVIIAFPSCGVASGVGRRSADLPERLSSDWRGVYRIGGLICKGLLSSIFCLVSPGRRLSSGREGRTRQAANFGKISTSVRFLQPQMARGSVSAFKSSRNRGILGGNRIL